MREGVVAAQVIGRRSRRTPRAGPRPRWRRRTGAGCRSSRARALPARRCAPSRSRYPGGPRAPPRAADRWSRSTRAWRARASRQVDQPEAAGGEHDRLLRARLGGGAALLGDRVLVGAQRDRALDDRLRVARASVRPATTGILDARRRAPRRRLPTPRRRLPARTRRRRRARRGRRPRASRRSAGETARPASARGRRGRPGGRGAAPSSTARSRRLSWSSWRLSTANASGSRMPEWWATSS